MPATEKLTRVLRESSDPDNPGPDAIRRIVAEARTIAVVGLSRDPAKAARRVPSYLSTRGFRVIPVNPHADRILGQEALASLDDLEEAVDLVLVFRPSADAGAVVDQARRRDDEAVIWLQEGIRADEAAERARAEGRVVVQDLCIFKVYRLFEEDLRSSTGVPG